MAFFVLGMLFLTSTVPLASADEDSDFLSRSSKAFTSVVKKVMPAVVHIRVEKTVKNTGGFGGDDDFYNNPFFQQFFGPQFRQQPRQFKQQGQGSGFIISKDGEILTNNHVVEGADSITVILSDKQQVKAKLIGADPETDIALLKIDDGDNLPVVPLGDSDALEVGEWVIAIGNPFGLSQTVTVGVVSAKGRNQVGINDYENFIQTDAAINPGNSGGPLLNIHGEVIGINSALYTKTGGYMGIGFAIPINMVKTVEAQLNAKGKVTRGWVGVAIQNVDENLAKSFNLKKAEGILISEVQHGSPADKAGLKQGDVILRLNNTPLDDANDLRNQISLLPPGSKAGLQIIRDGKTQDIEITIGEQPANFSKLAKGGSADTTGLNQFGLSMQNLSPELAERFGYKQDQGVIIKGVEPGSTAALAGLKPGLLIEEVNRQRVHTLQELDTVLRNSKTSKRVLLRVQNGEFSQYVVLTTE
ncbi:MAG: DegQ family serine endoprotease [Puia sp.]|nr:DegQ family serine endoprotease [Puia sp.]